MTELNTTDRERFWARVERGPGCWLWTQFRDPEGYGRFWVVSRRRRVRAHRVAFELETGINPGDLFVCHTCDNPRCVHPDHLFMGTSEDNSRDRDSKGRQARGTTSGARTQPHRVCRGSRNGRAKLDEAMVRALRAEIAGGMSLSEVARRFAVSVQVIWAIHHRKRWRHVS